MAHSEPRYLCAGVPAPSGAGQLDDGELADIKAYLLLL